VIAWLLPAALAAAPPEGGLVYFVFVDRFADGLPDDSGTIDRADPHAWHGGDLPGAEARLDHLAGMGVSTVWLSPVFNSRQDKFHGHGAFHGYWVEDMDGVEARFGGNAALSSLALAAKGRDIDLVLDMVYNHVSFDAPMLQEHPDWFHPPQTIEDWNDPTEVVTHQVHGLPDLAQEEEAVYHYLLGRSLYWSHLTDAAGFRIDAVRHMPSDFLHQLSADLKAQRGEGFWILGEDFQGDPLALSESFRDGGFDAMFDFPLRYAMVDVFCNDQPAGRLASVLSADRLYDDPHGLVTFLDNHDLPRIASECGGERSRVEAALLFMFAVRGTPSITYGTEWMLEGPGEPENRADVPWEQPPVLAETIRQLQALRASHPSLSSRSAEDRLLEVSAERLYLSRYAAGERAYILANRSDVPIAMVYSDAVQSWAVTTPSGLAVGDGSPPPIPPGGVGITFTESTPWKPPEAAVVSLSGGEGWLVGSGPELGNWNPDEGVALGEGAELTLPVGAVMEWKVVTRDVSGAVVWPEGANRYNLISGDTTITVD